MFKFIVFLVLFLGGIVLLGIAHELPAWQPVVFAGGILAVSLSIAVIIHSPSNAKYRQPGVES